MQDSARILRRAVFGVVILAIGQLVLNVIDPYGIFSMPMKVGQIILAVVLFAGILPGSYVTKVIRRIGERASTLPNGRVIFVAIGTPLLALALYGYFASGELAQLSQIDDPATQINFWFSVLLAVSQLAILALNSLDIARTSSRRSGA